MKCVIVLICIVAMLTSFGYAEDDFTGTHFGEPEPTTIITETGVVLDRNYTSRRIIDYADGYFIVEYNYDKTRYCGMIDMDGNTIIEPEWLNCQLFSEGMALVWSHGFKKLGYFDENGEMVIAFDGEHVWYIYQFREGRALINYEGRWCCIDKSGETVAMRAHPVLGFGLVDPDYIDRNSFNDGRAIVFDTVTSKYGYVDKSGEVVIPCIYDSESSAFSNGVAYVVLDGKEGVIDINGNYLIPCKYDWVLDYADGVAVVEIDDQRGLVDTDGNWICEPGNYWFEGYRYGDTQWLDDGYTVIVKDELYGIMDLQGNVIIEPVWDFACSRGNNVMFVIKDGMCAFTDITKVDDIRWTFRESGQGFGYWGMTEEAALADGYYMIRSDGKYGVVDLDGNIVIEPICDYEIQYSNGLFAVCIDGKAGFVDAEGNTVIDLDFDRTCAFGGGIAPVVRGGLGFIDLEGNVVIDFVWDYVEDEYARDDEYVVPCYEHDGKTVYVVTSGNTDYLIDTEGNIVY